MSYEFLKCLFMECSAEEGGRNAEGLNLSELYERLEDVAVAMQHFNEAVDRAVPGHPAVEDDVMSATCELTRAYELQGFLNGFRLCARMGREIFGEGAQA